MGRSSVRKIGSTSIRDIKARIQALPTSVAHDVAQRAAPLLTNFARASFTARENVYGDPWPIGANGNQVSLIRTGATARALGFVANGSILRCILGNNYQRYLIGKYKILPIGDRSAIPAKWFNALNQTVRDVQAANRRAA